VHWQPLVFYRRKVVGRVVGGLCHAHTVPDNVHQLHVQQTFAYEKLEAASAVLAPYDGRCVARNMLSII
jgi:hypothetical protein